MIDTGARTLGRVGRYEMIAPIAAGGMASVWAARLRGPAGFSKIVAIKSMLPDLADEPEYRMMFLDEARVASRLRHPNVCETFDLGEEGGALFMAMEWIDGASLHRVLKSGGAARPIALEIAARIIAAACAGLHAAHEAIDDDGTPLAIVHRDVSPQNILVGADGRVKVTDFGVAAARGQRHTTRAGQAKGKLAYMAPELLRGGAADRRVDVFALGCVLYEITTGQKPFDAPTDALLFQAILNHKPKLPSEIIDGYPDELERLVARALAKDPDQRFASADGLRMALERWLASRSVRASERDIAALVEERCGPEIAAIRTQLQTAAGSSQPIDVTSATALTRPTRLEGSRGDRRGARFVAAFGALVIAIAGGSVAWSESRARAEEQAAHERVAATVLEPAAIGPSAAITTTPSTRAESPAAVNRVTVRFDPPDAHVVVDGEPLELDAEGSAFLVRPPEGELRVGLVKAPGHVDRLFVIDPNTPSTLEVPLSPSAPAVVSARLNNG